MRKRNRTRSILYCSAFDAHRTHRTLVEFVNRRGWDVIYMPWDEQSISALTESTFIDGVISHLDDNATKQLLKITPRTPHVTLNALAASEIGIPGVVLNHRAAGRIIGKHLIELGFHHIAAFGHLHTNATFAERMAGATEITSEAGLAPPHGLPLPPKEQSPVTKLAYYADALKALPAPLAVIAYTDGIAVTLMHACRLSGFSIPSQVAICSFDNDPISCDLALVPLSSVETNLEQQAIEAATLLAILMDGQPPPATTIVIEPAGMIVRRSTGIVANANITVAKALAYIHQHAWQADLNVPEIAQMTGMSKRTLFMLFKRELSISPLQYINKLRVKKAQSLLQETNTPINKIFRQCGFASYYQMHQAFKRTTGHSPKHFQKVGAEGSRGGELLFIRH